MKIFTETPRLLLREIVLSDAEGMFTLDSDPEVHRYLGGKPVGSLEESRKIIAFIRDQYETNGIGRWAVIDKDSGEFIGWAGLKLVKENVNGFTGFYDVGYRLIRKHWGKGYATEAAIASISYGFETLGLDDIYATPDAANHASRKVLEKAGMKLINTFNDDGVPTLWYHIGKHAR